LAASSIGLLVSERTASQFEQAVAQYDEGDWTAADNMAQTVAFREPDWPPYQFTMGLTAASVGDHARAAEAFRTAALADDLPEAWLDLAAEQAILGQDDEARSSLTRAARLGLQRPALALAIGDLALRLGDAGLVEEGFSMALSKLPSLAGDEWWQRDLTRAARFPAVLGRAIAGASPDLGWQIALAAGEADRARALAATLYPPGSLANDIIDAWLGDLAALERVEDTCRGSPTSTGAVDWCARLAARSGDLHAADAYREWSFLNLGDPAGPFEVRVAKEPIIGRNILGSVADFYGTYTYRRPTPWNPLVPSLPQLTAE
jgi:tetratricopeptide (TPR) repeat protein